MPKLIGNVAVEGETIAPPDTVDMRQARLMLHREAHPQAGTRLAAVDAWVATQDAEVDIEWHYATSLRRDHPMVAVMALFFGQQLEDIDQWFRGAAAIGPMVAQG